MWQLAPCILGAIMGLPAGARPVAVRVECGLDRCPDVEALRARLSAVLGYDAVREDAGRQVRVRFEAAGAGVATELELHEGSQAAGARRFETALDWDAVVSATVMNLALIVDPGRLDLLVPAPPAAAPEPAPLTTAPEPAPPTTTPEPEPRQIPVPPAADDGPLGVTLVLGGGASLGATPGLTGQLHLAGHTRFGLLGVELGLRYSFATSERFAGGDVFADLLAADLAGCVHLGPDGRYTGCLTALAGVQGVGATDLPRSRDANLSAVAVGARGRIGWPLPALPALELGLGLDLRLPLWRTRLRVDGQLVWESAPVVVDGLLTTAWRF